MKTLVSILIPAYNAAQWINETLESALAQTWPLKEIIVVDDGSTDNTLALTKTYESATVKVISQTNQGASAARNRAVREAQGDFIQYLDADDLLDPRKIETQVARLLGDAPGLVASCQWGRFYNSIGDAKFNKEPTWHDMSPLDFLLLHCNYNFMMHPAAWLLPRAVADKAGAWDERLSLNDDGEYFCRALLSSRGILYCDEARTFYRSGIENSLSKQKGAGAYPSLYKSVESCAQHLLAAEDSPRVRQALANYYYRFMCEIYPAMPELQARAQARMKQLGRPTVVPPQGRVFQLFSPLVGWRLAKRMSLIVNDFRGGRTNAVSLP
jgi:glycosyltransferase involved in cell wall biosynthesis